MTRTGARPLHRIALVRIVSALLACVVGASSGYAQECPELPALPQPELRECGVLDRLTGACARENQAMMSAWEEQMRRFGTPVPVAFEGEAASATFEYAIGGCRGSIVNVDLEADRLSRLQYELIAPSGTTVAAEQLVPRSGRALGQAIRLPESGYYRMRLTTTTTAERRQRCIKVEGSPLQRRCVEEETYTAYPVDFVVAFRGDAPALRLGERGEGTATRQQPLARRVAVEAGDLLRTRVIATGGQITCRVEAPDGSAVPVTAAPDGCQADFPEGRRDATYVVAVTTTGNAPVGVAFVVEAMHSSSTTLRIGAQAEGTFETTATTGAPARGQVEWTADLAEAGRYVLTVVPSGLARLQVEVTLYNRATEEVLIDRARVSARQTFTVDAPVAGLYVLRLTPLTYDAQAAQGGARYTLLLDR